MIVVDVDDPSVGTTRWATWWVSSSTVGGPVLMSRSAGARLAAEVADGPGRQRPRAACHHRDVGIPRGKLVAPVTVGLVVVRAPGTDRP